MSTLECIKLKPDESFYKEEVICGYTVTSKRKKIWAIEIDLLSEFDRVCKKHNINYCLFAGSLLGAVRHNGFIPWDDDLDVCLLREDFEKLMIVPKDEFDPPYFLQTPLSDRRFFCSYARLRNSETTAALQWTQSPEYNNGIYIDIYCMDGYLGECFKSKMQFLGKKMVRMCLNAYNAEISYLEGSKRLIYGLLKNTVCKMKSYEDLYNLYKQIIMKYNRIANRFVDSSSNKFEEMERLYVHREDLDNLKVVPFEYISVLIPENYDMILKSAYGDYMKFPPLDEVDKWHGEMIEFDPDTPYKDFFAGKRL